MTKPMILGINRTQDASLSLLDGQEMLFSIQKERLTRERHHWGKLGDISLYLSRIRELNKPIDLIVEGYSSDKEIENINLYHEELKNVLNLKNTCEIIQISHHLSHAYSAYFTSSYSEAAIMIIDSVGSHVTNFTEKVCIPPQHKNSFEVASYYIAKGKKLNCIHKQFWCGDKKQPAGLGQFYYLLTQCIFPGQGYEGKVMGLAPYGNAQNLNLPPLIFKEGDLLIPDEWKVIFNNSEKFSFFRNGGSSFQDCADLSASGQKAFEEGLLAITSWLKKQSKMEQLCYAGGTALNCSANGMLIKKSDFKKIFIPPAPHDGGTSIGCALYGLNYLNFENNFYWKTDYLGPKQSIDILDLKKMSNDFTVSKPENLIELTANILKNGNIVALFDHESEFGPRALGHRSIIADPRYSVMTQWINQAIKNREWFRPIAPIVLEEDMQMIFDMDQPSPYMLYAVLVREKYRKLISAAVHVDGTARVQTVNKNQNDFLYKLLNVYKEIIGIGVLLNTSFNKKEPIIETFDEAVNCIQKMPVNYLISPPFLIEKKLKVPSPFLLSDINVAVQKQNYVLID